MAYVLLTEYDFCDCPSHMKPVAVLEQLADKVPQAASTVVTEVLVLEQFHQNK